MKVVAGVLRLVAAALFAVLVTGSAAHAQRPTSNPRIPISKEEPQRIARVDTVYSYRTDTLRVPGRPDTVTVNRYVDHFDTVYVKTAGHSCWSRLSLCYIVPVAAAGLFAYECAEHRWCPRNNGDVDVNTNVQVFASHARRLGFAYSFPLP